MNIDIVFSSYNGAGTLPRMLDALTRLETAHRWRVIAVDNASDDDTANVLNGHADRLPLTVLSEPRRGKNRALNRALEVVQGELVVFTDDDVVVETDWIDSLADCVIQNPEFDVFGGRILPSWPTDPDPLIVENAPLGITYAITPPDQQGGPINPGLIWGPNMAVRKSVFDDGHRFLETVGPSAGSYIMGSETEFTLRLGRHGHRSWYCDRAVVNHLIRPHQLSAEWVVERARRFGRNQWVQECNFPPEAKTPKLFGVPRWRFSRLGTEYLRYATACVRRDRKARFLADWEIRFLHGYLQQAFNDTRRTQRGAGE